MGNDRLSDAATPKDNTLTGSGPLRITRVVIVDLFGLFDHDIIMKDTGITIIHALNGYGKTTVLRLIYQTFTKKLASLLSIQFRRIEYFFDNKTMLKISRDAERRELIFSLHATDGHAIKSQIEKITIKPLQAKNTRFDPSDFLPFLVRVERDQWFDQSQSRALTRQEIIEEYAEQFPDFVRSDFAEATMPEWLSQTLRQVRCRFIEAQRLLREFDEDFERYVGPRRKRKIHRAVIEDDSQQIMQLFNAEFGKYASTAQSLDRTFPNRVISAIRSRRAIAASELSTRLDLIEAQRRNLISVGLLNEDQNFIQPDPDAYSDQEIAPVLDTYADDMEKKLKVFDSLFSRCQAFLTIINRRLRHKKLSLSRERGIVVQTQESPNIPLSSLSSGEQHQIVMMFDLIFNAEEEDLLLLDEPELSLHVSWQKAFLPDIDEIRKINGMYFLIATHSPQIINDKWDLTVALEDRKA